MELELPDATRLTQVVNANARFNPYHKNLLLNASSDALAHKCRKGFQDHAAATTRA